MKSLLTILILSKATLEVSFDVVDNDLQGILKSIEERLDLKMNDMREEMKEEFQQDLEERVTKLEQLARIGTLRSCAEYARYGLDSSGPYIIDPDGPLLGQEPFQVYCNFTSGEKSYPVSRVYLPSVI